MHVLFDCSGFSIWNILAKRFVFQVLVKLLIRYKSSDEGLFFLRTKKFFILTGSCILSIYNLLLVSSSDAH